MDNGYLCHYGVQGMRWGIRKYRNKDGSLRTNKNNKRKNKKISKAILDSKGNYVNRHKLGNKITSEINKTKEGTARNNLIKKRGVSLGDGKFQLAYLDKEWSNPKKVKYEMIKDKQIMDSYDKKLNQLAKKYNNAFLGATLKDIGFKDTKDGREYLKKMGIHL